MQIGEKRKYFHFNGAWRYKTKSRLLGNLLICKPQQRCFVSGFERSRLIIGFCRIDRGDKYFPDLSTMLQNNPVFRISTFQQKLRPIFTFGALFQCDMKLCDKVGFTVGIKCFTNVCANTGAGAHSRFVKTDSRLPVFTSLHNRITSKAKAFDLSSKMLLLIKSLVSIRRGSRHLSLFTITYNLPKIDPEI